jgi:hypothetical protein
MTERAEHGKMLSRNGLQLHYIHTNLTKEIQELGSEVLRGDCHKGIMP